MCRVSCQHKGPRDRPLTSFCLGNSLTSLGSLEGARLPQLAEVTANHNKLESLTSDIATNWPIIKK